MSAAHLETLESDLSRAGRAFPYPPTPAIALHVMSRIAAHRSRRAYRVRWTWAVAAVLILLSALMFVPPARAAILNFIQIGVVRIFRGPEPAPVPPPTALPLPQTPLTATPRAQAPTITARPSSLPDLAGATTLREAQAAVSFPIQLPAYPPDLGAPDRVYLQHPGDSMVILLWLQPDASGHIRMSLQEIGAGSWQLSKFSPRVLQQVLVNGQPGAWAEGPYVLEMRNGNYAQQELVAGHALIWTQGKVTYRLESELSVEEAIKVAESLQPIRSAGVPIPSDLGRAEPLVQWLIDAGIPVLSVQHSKEGALFQSANQAAWILTNQGIADAVFLDPADSEHVTVASLPSQEAGRYFYRVQAPPSLMLNAVTIDAAYPLYFTVRRGMFIETSSEQLDQVFGRLPVDGNQQP